MSLLATLENGLFALAQVLRLPVMALLWVCVAAAGVARILAVAPPARGVRPRAARLAFSALGTGFGLGARSALAP